METTGLKSNADLKNIKYKKPKDEKKNIKKIHATQKLRKSILKTLLFLYHRELSMINKL